MRWRRAARLSLAALLAHRLRGALAIASVAAGVATVVITAAIDTGVRGAVDRSIEAIGANLVVVRPAQLERSAARREIVGSATTLRIADYQAIAELPLVGRAAPTVEGAVTVKGGNAATRTMMVGTSPDFPAIRRFALRSGRFFDHDDDRDARRVVVLGARVADALFDSDPVGRQIRIRGVPFDVIGVLAAKGVLANGDEDNQVIVPIRTALRRVFNVTWLSSVLVSAKDRLAVGGVENAITTLLGRSHPAGRDEQPDFEVQDATRFFALQQRAAESLARLGAALAAVTVVVGGTGIMALMTLSVKERTGEIGLRIAVGARRRDVAMQFVLEATLLAVGGSVVGIVAGSAGAWGVGVSTSMQVAVPLQAIVGSLVMALVMGVTFGVLPARRAAMTPPVRALSSR